MAKQIKREELTQELLQKALGCKNADELLELAKTEGYEMTKEEAEAYMAEIADMELDAEALEKVAGAGPHKCWTY